MIKPEQVLEFLIQAGVDATDYEADNVSTRHSNTVYRLTDKTSGGRPTLYFKDYSQTPDGEERLYAELATIALLREQTDVPVPESKLLVPNSFGGPCLLQNELPGVPLEKILGSTDRRQAETLVERSARILFQIHQVRSDLFGNVDNSRGNRYTTWRSCFCQNIDEKLANAKKKNVLTINQIDYFRRRLEDSALDMAEISILIHGDFEPQNILIDPDTPGVSGILDFESARFWQSDWDLTRVAATSFIGRPELLDRFILTYASIAGSTINELQDRIEFYKIFESLHFWVWGWGRTQKLNNYIAKDVVRATGIS